MNPFMLAVEKDNVEVVKAMMKEDPDLMSLPVGSGTTVIHWALEEGHHRNAFFKVLCFCNLRNSMLCVSLLITYNQFHFISIQWNLC